MPQENQESLELAKVQYQAGKEAFERGRYRQSVQHLEKAVSLVFHNSPLGGEIQIWLVTAYEAAGQMTEAIELCEKVAKHPDLDTRKQGSRLLYILKAPRLRTRPEWLTQIPDLSQLDDPDRTDHGSTRVDQRVVCQEEVDAVDREASVELLLRHEHGIVGRTLRERRAAPRAPGRILRLPRWKTALTQSKRMHR